MFVRKPSDVQDNPVDMEGVQGVSMRLLLGRADGAPTFAMRQFTVKPGGHTPRHQHDYEHGVYIAHGSGTVEFGGKDHHVAAGDALFIEPNQIHQFRADQGDELVFLCMVPTTFDCGKPTPGS
ncbi:MAG: cupin domain-containing protein [Planctomycetes bacterium]|nr:cupin domain-containing protein [Planctomycetota bacterium]NOG55468.1 cupin domain-containing protein [Planctomycetota bacterium]